MRLAFLGDVMLGRLVNNVLKETPATYVWGDTLHVLRQADARIINLECVIADHGEPWPGKTFTYRSDAKNVAVLKEAAISAVSLANNHSQDYGQEALVECLDILERHSIPYAGAGRSIAEAMRPAVFKVDLMRVAVIAFTDNEPGWKAAERQSGIFYVPVDTSDRHFKQLEHLTQTVRRSSDFVIVSAHWGPNWGYDPLPSHRKAARALIEAGVDVVFGHSPHIFRGIEIYKGKPILYSCGDFIDDYAVDEIERNDWSAIFMLDYENFQFKKITIVPTVIRNCQARLAEGGEKETIAWLMRRLCADLGTDASVGKDGIVIIAPPG